MLLCYFVGDAAAVGSPSRYGRLQEFVESSMPQPLNWRLCANCQQATWCGTGVDPDMKLKAAQDSDRSMCTSVSAVQSHLPLEPCSSLSYRQAYHTDDGKQVFVQPTKSSRPREEHEAVGMGYSQQATKKRTTIAISCVLVVDGFSSSMLGQCSATCLLRAQTKKLPPLMP